MMKKKRETLVYGTALLLTCLVVGISVTASSSFPYQKWGKRLNEYHQKKDEGIAYAIGEHGMITVDEVELAKYCYSLQGLTDEEAEKAAVNDCMKREATYQKACREGYSVTDQEIWDFINEYKLTIKEAENYNELEQIMSQFDSEQDYWNFQFSIYKKDLVIIKFIQDYQADFNQNNNFQDASERDAAWSACYDKLRNDLVAEENFQIVE